MYVLLLTGGAGAGKSEAGRFFSERGAVVIDSDNLAHDAIEPDGPAYRDVLDAFGEGILGQGGRIRPGLLAAAAFADPDSTKRLNAAVHPHVTRELNRLIAALYALEVPPEVVVVEVPLLTEVPQIADLADHVLDIEADPRVRIARLVDRGMDEADALRRMARQGTEEERAALSGTVIRNDADPGVLRERLAAFWIREVAPHVA